MPELDEAGSPVTSDQRSRNSHSGGMFKEEMLTGTFKEQREVIEPWNEYDRSESIEENLR